MGSGFGFTSFTQQGTDALTGAGAAWTLRAVFGADRALSVEGAYVRGAYPVTGRSGENGTIVQNGLEGLAGLGFRLRGDLAYVRPYVTVGVNATLFNAAGVDSATTGDDERRCHLCRAGRVRLRPLQLRSAPPLSPRVRVEHLRRGRGPRSPHGEAAWRATPGARVVASRAT